VHRVLVRQISHAHRKRQSSVKLKNALENHAFLSYIECVGSGNPYSIDTESRDSFIHFTVTGKRVNREVALSYWQEIIDECDRSNCSKILLDHNFEEMISMNEMLEVIGPVGDMLKGKIMAFYDRFGHYDIPEAGKMILRSQNVKMQIFHDLDEAEKWLEAN